MLAKQLRLKKRKHFNYIYKKGKSCSSAFVSICFAPSKQPIKIGFSVSKKIGNAVVRNKAKRRMSEAVKTFLPNLKQNINYVFVARSGIEKLTLVQITENMHALLTKNNFIIK